MTQVNINQKYHSFILPPKAQIFVGNEDITQKYGIRFKELGVKQLAGASSRFFFRMDDVERTWINSGLFELHKTVEVKMGYGNTVESVFAGEITAVRSIFLERAAPQIQVNGAENCVKIATESANGLPICSLDYAGTLYSFTSVATADTLGAMATSICCLATCVGLPEIEAGIVVSLTGLGTKFSKNYLIDEAVHRLDDLKGFRTKFRARMQPPPGLKDRKTVSSTLVGSLGEKSASFRVVNKGKF